jgi:UDP-glucose 4-epimerase
VLELIQAFELTTGVRVPFRIVPRRDGDIAVSFADASLALRELGWKARHDLTDMCRDTWKWQRAMSRAAQGAMPETPARALMRAGPSGRKRPYTTRHKVRSRS